MALACVCPSKVSGVSECLVKLIAPSLTIGDRQYRDICIISSEWERKRERERQINSLSAGCG